MPKMLRELLHGYVVVHVYDVGWASMPDHELLPKAEAEHFEVLLTNDKRMYSQQNHAKRRIALVVVSTNSRETIRRAHEMIRSAVEQATPGSYVTVDLPKAV